MAQHHIDPTRHVGKTAIVTGVGSGIGRAILVRLVAEGATVVGLDVNQAGEEQTAAMVADHPGSARFEVVDVADQEAIDRVIATIGSRVDILVNNAGIMDHFLPLTELDDATWERVLAVNLTGVMRLTRAVLPLMRAAGAGSIVTIASESSLRAGAAGVAYTTSKHAVLGLVKHVAYFYGPEGIRSNAVLPGGVNTGIGATAAPASAWAWERASRALGAAAPSAEPDQIAAAVSWLASDEASNVNGALVADDGGWSAA